MKRRNFFKAFAGALLATELPMESQAEVKRPVYEASPKLNLRKIELQVGATTPFKAVHVSDTHIVRVDKRDTERKIMLAAGRARNMLLGEHYLNEAIFYARQHGMMLIHTGDMMDFVSESNLDLSAGYYTASDWLVCAGNHEYSQYVGEAKEDAAYKAQSYQKVQEAYPNDLTFFSRVVNGVNFVSIDDVYYNVTAEQHRLMEEEVKKGLPIVLLCHVPFYTPKHCEYELKLNNQKAGYMTGVPEKITKTYEPGRTVPAGEEWKLRSVQQKADKETLEFTKWLKHQSLLKGILCGHMHYFYEERFSKTAMQYTCGATFAGDAYEVSFV